MNQILASSVVFFENIHEFKFRIIHCIKALKAHSGVTGIASLFL